MPLKGPEMYLDLYKQSQVRRVSGVSNVSIVCN